MADSENTKSKPNSMEWAKQKAVEAKARAAKQKAEREAFELECQQFTEGDEQKKSEGGEFLSSCAAPAQTGRFFYCGHPGRYP